jgi:hypothetical protein
MDANSGGKKRKKIYLINKNLEKEVFQLKIFCFSIAEISASHFIAHLES